MYTYTVTNARGQKSTFRNILQVIEHLSKTIFLSPATILRIHTELDNLKFTQVGNTTVSLTE